MDKITDPKSLSNAFRKRSQDKAANKPEEVTSNKVTDSKSLNNSLTKKRLNEALIDEIAGYVPKLKSKGLKGTPELTGHRPSNHAAFNLEYKKLFEVYKEVIGLLYYAEGYVEGLKNDLHVSAFKADEVEKRHFKFQPDILIEELQKLSRILVEDYNIVRSFERDLLIESLEGLYQNRKNLGIEEAKEVLKELDSVVDIMNRIKSFFSRFYALMGLSDYCEMDKKIEIKQGQVIFKTRINIKNKYLRIRYPLEDLDENILRRIREIEEDVSILQVVKKG
ncbi:MAG: hypothetical protein BWY64_04060 [bacterium ADurb.Bin363]|nr:MAG: hypothetical protein BWY64_04060 [bacterium ADurb.Bin363]